MLHLTPQEARDIIHEENEDWKYLHNTEIIIGKRRWVTEYSVVCQHIPSKRHYLFKFEKGSTEMQDCIPYEFEDEVCVPRVVEKEVARKEWVIEE